MTNVATKAKKPNLSVKSVLNWILDHAMIIVIVLLALYSGRSSKRVWQ